MRTFNLTLSFFVGICFFSYGQKYYTLNSGNWNNTTNVWSLNGITPCGCYPGNSLITDSIFVNHPINLTGNLSASSLSKIQIYSNGSLSNSNYRMSISNSIVLADGIINVKELNVATNGSLILNNSSLGVQSRILVSGYLEINASDIFVIFGNFEVYSSGTVAINGNSFVQLHNGNYDNDGLTSICDECCLTFQTGNIKNEGTFTGSGNIISENGNISNLGSWSSSLEYCTTGTDTGMPTPEDCAAASEFCTVFPLPSEIVYFKGSRKAGINILEWQSASESNSSFYKIDKSLDGENWFAIGVIDAAGNSTELLDYKFEDADKGLGMRYYKLTQVDNDGKMGLTETLSLANENNSDMFVYPNPTYEKATVELNKTHEYTNLKVMDSFGRILKDIKIDDSLTIEIQLPDKDGFYFITAEGENEQSTLTVVKM